MAAKRAAQGTGSIRKKTVTNNGKEYIYWEARITIGRDPGTGKQLQQSFSGKTLKEVREKMQAAAVSVNEGTYSLPPKMTVGQWLDIWTSEYLGNVKPRTVDLYTGSIRNHIRPALASIRLTELNTHTIQRFINSLQTLSPGSVCIIYRVLHIALEKAVQLNYIPRNPANNCVLPKEEKKEIIPLNDTQLALLLQTAKGSEVENIIIVSLFAGLRISEILGLTWDSIDESSNSIHVNKQLASRPHIDEKMFVSPKNGHSRTIKVPQTVMNALRDQKSRQKAQHHASGTFWHNKHNLVFTSENGDFYSQSKVTHRFRMLTNIAGLRFTYG